MISLFEPSGPVEQSTDEALGPEDFGPFVERQVAGDEGGGALIVLAEDLEEQLSACLSQQRQEAAPNHYRRQRCYRVG